MRKLALVQTAVERPFGFGNAVFFCGHRCYGYLFVFFVAGFYGLAEDFFGEIIPADIASFVGGMIVAVFLCFDHIYQKHGQIQSVSRRADLIADYPELIVGLSRFSMVLMKFLPFLPNTQAIRTMKYFSRFSETASSPSSLVSPYTFRAL